MENNKVEITLDELLGEPIDITNANSASFSKIALDLLKETGLVARVLPDIFESNIFNGTPFSKNQAVEAGLLVRIGKLIRSVLTLSADPTSEHGEVIIALNRCIVESSINLEFFCEKATQADFDKFIKSGLKAEKDLYETIQINSSERGHLIPIEERMLKSIDNTIKSSGFSNIKELGEIPRWTDYKTILRSINLEHAYPMLQGVPSHAIHGTWPELLLHNLTKKEGGFTVNTEPLTPDTRLFCPVSVIVLDAIKSYFNKYFSGESEGVSSLLNRIDELKEKNIEINNSHEGFINK